MLGETGYKEQEVDTDEDRSGKYLKRRNYH